VYPVAVRPTARLAAGPGNAGAEQGNDTPAILIENSTASNRAVNIPEFINIAPGNIAPGGLLAINPTVTGFYRHIVLGNDLLKKDQPQAAIAEFEQALATDSEDFEVENSLGVRRQLDKSLHYSS